MHDGNFYVYKFKESFRSRYSSENNYKILICGVSKNEVGMDGKYEKLTGKVSNTLRISLKITKTKVIVLLKSTIKSIHYFAEKGGKHNVFRYCSMSKT